MNKPQEDNLYIKSVIESNVPFFIGRIAGCELQVAYHLLKGDFMDIVSELAELENNAGILTKTNDSLQKYVEMLVESYDHCTVIAEWDRAGDVFLNTGAGQLLISNRTSHIPKINAIALEPYYFKDSWMSALKGKKLLIVHPFSDTFKKQVHKQIFPNWFEDCTFQFIKPPFTLAGNHDNRDWQEHFQECIKSIDQLEKYDIALVAAGGYGMLLADHIFKSGASVMYIGGALQIFFGVIGKRWFENKDILMLMNRNWIRPEEKPHNFKNVEKGCYW